MIDLTPAQLRLIKEAQTKDDGHLNFYGVPEKTQQKLRDGGLVQTVFANSPDEREAIRAEVKDLCDHLKASIDTSTSVQIGRTARAISNLSSQKLFATKDVLTDLGKAV
jgi:hypothetical protein